MPIVQYWHAEAIPDEIEALFASFRENNPDVRHLVFNETTADEFIAERFSQREVEAFRACAPPPMQADYFRCCAIYALGGMWIDADTRCMASLSSILKPEGGELFQFPGRRGVVNGCFIFRRPGHPLLRLTLDIITLNIENRVSERIDFVTGPAVFTMLIGIQRLGSLDTWIEGAPRRLRWAVCRNRRHHELLRAVITDGQRAGAFEDIRVSSQAKLKGLIVHPVAGLTYKSSTYYRSNFEGNIYR